MAGTGAKDRGSLLLLEEAFESGDERFLSELFSSSAAQALGGFSAKWYADKRPFARSALYKYIDDGCDRPHHRALVKRLFKLAENADDDEVMAHFLVAFDRITKRKLVKKKRYDWVRREMITERVLARAEGQPQHVGNKNTKAERFSVSTRQYLARRAYRYARRLGRSDAARFRNFATMALLLYQDQYLSTPTALLDAWSLMHLLYRHSNVLHRQARGIVLRHGQSMSDLEPAPAYLDAWRDGFASLLTLTERAPARAVRAWSMQLFRTELAEQMATVAFGRIRRLARSLDAEVQAFSAELLRHHKNIAEVSIDDWMLLLSVDSLDVGLAASQLFEEHVSPKRLDLPQLVQLVGAPTAPAAELGFQWLKDRGVKGPDELTAVMATRDAPAPTVREHVAEWLEKLVTDSGAKEAHVRDLLDARYPEPRAVALRLSTNQPHLKQSLSLWHAMAESPYDDVRAHLVRHVQTLRLPAESVRHVWATTLLNVHRGGRAKRFAMSQLADRIVKKPNEADDLLPLLGVILRSCRAAERRAAVAAVVRAAYRLPPLRASIATHLPALTVGDEDAA